VADITGFGATTAAWDAGHTPDPDAPKGSYWPRYANGEDTYQDVRFIRGRALSYVENIYPAETVAQARAVIGDEMPPDAHVVSETRVAGGERVVVESAVLRAATGDNAAVVMRSPGAVFDPNDVTSLTYSAVPAG
jgi:hypothetical protein